MDDGNTRLNEKIEEMEKKCILMEVQISSYRQIIADTYTVFFAQKKISIIAESALAAFEDLDLSTAAEVAQWDLLKIWRASTNDKQDLARIEQIECRLNPNLLVK